MIELNRLIGSGDEKGIILVQKGLQEAKAKYCAVKDTWDAALSDKLWEDAIKLLEEYAVLVQ